MRGAMTACNACDVLDQVLNEAGYCPDCANKDYTVCVTVAVTVSPDMQPSNAHVSDGVLVRDVFGPHGEEVDDDDLADRVRNWAYQYVQSALMYGAGKL